MLMLDRPAPALIGHRGPDEPGERAPRVTGTPYAPRMATLVFRDETATGRELARFELLNQPEQLTVEEIIRLRVRDEVARHNAAPQPQFLGLVQPDDAEVELNGYRLTKVRRLNWEKQADVAVKAFSRNGFLMFVGGRQVMDLTEVVDLSAAHDVAFVKLVPLVGG